MSGSVESLRVSLAEPAQAAAGCIARCSTFEHTTDAPAPLYCTRALNRSFYGEGRPPGQIAISRYYTEEQSGLRSARLRSGDVVFDIGPHNGYFTMRAAGIVGPSGLVVAIEASLVNYALVEKMIVCNGVSDHVRLIYGAVFSSDDEPLHLFSQDGNDMKNKSTVGNTVHSDWTGKRSGVGTAGFEGATCGWCSLTAAHAFVLLHSRQQRVNTNETVDRVVTSVTVDALVRRLRLPRVDHIFATVNGIEMDALMGDLGSL